MSTVADRSARASNATTGVDAALLIGRLCMAYLFVMGGWEKLMDLAGFAAYLSKLGIPAQYSYALAVVGACVEFFGGVCIVLGLVTSWVALLLAVHTLIAALLAHRYWTVADHAQTLNQMIHFNKNLAIIGGFLILYAAGPGRWSLDRRGS